MAELTGTLLGIVGGAVAGFLTSFYFWNKNRKKERPRILIGARGQGFLDGEEGSAQSVFDIRNVGSTYMEKICITERKTGREIRAIQELHPDESEHLTILKRKESVDIRIEYQDVWGKKYQSIWCIEGPHWIETGEEDGRQFEPTPYGITRIDK